MKRLLCAVLLLFCCTGCAPQPAPETARLQIVTTAFPQYDFARSIAGDDADVTLLLAAGQDVHSFEPTPLDVAAVSRCDLFLRIGGESEVWTDQLIASLSLPASKVVTYMEHIAVPLAEEAHDHDTAEEAHEEEFDEHIWNSPVNAIAMVEATRDAMCRADAAHAEQYRQRAEAYLAKLHALDEEFRALPAENAVLVVADRFPFRYLAAEYGFDYVAAFSGCSSETEPTIHSLHMLTEACRKNGASTVFYLEFSSDKIAERVCAMTGAKAAMLHPCHTVSAQEMEEGVSYLTLMQENYETIREALT